MFFVGFFLLGNLISILHTFQLLTDHVSHLSGNAGKKSLSPLEETVVVPGILGGTETLQVSRVTLPMNFWCSTTLPWTVPSIGSPPDKCFACSSAPACFTPSGHCIGNVWGYAYSAFASQDASCSVDRTP